MDIGYDSAMEMYGHTGVLTVSGETDLFTARHFKRDLDAAMDFVPGDLVLDLSDVDLVDSTALGVLIRAFGRMSDEGRSLVVVVTRRHVLRVFSITGLQATFRIVDSLQEALEGLMPRRVRYAA